MAFSRNGNIIYVSSPGTESGKFQLLGIVATSTAANAALAIKDGNDDKLVIRVPTANDTKDIDLINRPIRFNTSINVTTATTIEATLIVKPLGD